MDIRVSGHQIDTGEALRDQVDDRLHAIAEKYFSRAISAQVTFGKGPHFCLFVHHTDGEREYAYDRQSKVGRLDEALDQAGERGWKLISMKDDWKTIFPPANVPKE